MRRDYIAGYLAEQILEARERGEPYAPPLDLVNRCWIAEISWLVDCAEKAAVCLSSALLTREHVLEVMQDEARKYGLEIHPIVLEANPDTPARDCVLLVHREEAVGIPVSTLHHGRHPSHGNHRLAAIRMRVKWMAAGVLQAADRERTKRGRAA